MLSRWFDKTNSFSRDGHHYLFQKKKKNTHTQILKTTFSFSLSREGFFLWGWEI